MFASEGNVNIEGVVLGAYVSSGETTHVLHPSPNFDTNFYSFTLYKENTNKV